MFLSSLVLASYIRVEALLLIPIFIIIFFTFGEQSISKSLASRVKAVRNKTTFSKALPLLLVFSILMLPEIYAILATQSILLVNALPFLNSNSQIFAISYLPNNILQNALFLSGGVATYPIIFLPEIGIFAMLGVAYLTLHKEQKGNSVLLMLLCLFFGYLIFYCLYFSGSALLGGSVRFLLILYPALSILAAFGVYGTSKLISSLFDKSPKNKKLVFQKPTITVLVILFFITPFFYAIPFLTHPNYLYSDFPTIPNTTSQSNPYSMMYANRSLTFINENYNLIPSSCLVLSPSPYLWYGLNRSAAYVNLYNSSDPQLKNYGCFVLDYSYFCGNPFNNTSCNTILAKYKLKVLATESGDMSTNFSLYQIMNYTPS